uniref:glycine cleavage system protein R n=1 Tax=Thaumasiovibrio occultus TaxID=1891184 RepID=UPI000B34D788|nr:ACT domain-containing protein [Thaumasiovibrio occultus]
MSTQFTITLAGQDRPQIMHQLAQVTHRHDGKWLVSQIHRLDGQIVGIIRIDAPEPQHADLKHALTQFTECHIRVIDAVDAQPLKMEKATLNVEAKDRTGLVHDLTAELDRLGIDVLRIENHRLGVPEAGQVLFFAKLEVSLPESADKWQITRLLEEVEPSMNVELS